MPRAGSRRLQTHLRFGVPRANFSHESEGATRWAAGRRCDTHSTNPFHRGPRVGQRQNEDETPRMSVSPPLAMRTERVPRRGTRCDDRARRIRGRPSVPRQLGEEAISLPRRLHCEADDFDRHGKQVRCENRAMAAARETRVFGTNLVYETRSKNDGIFVKLEEKTPVRSMCRQHPMPCVNTVDGHRNEYFQEIRISRTRENFSFTGAQ